jgi:methionyl-tRNA formyltransferase
MAVHLSELGYVPEGVLALSTLNRKTLLRKLGQWGTHEVARYALTKLFSTKKRDEPAQMHNPELRPWLQHAGETLRSVGDVAGVYGFPVATCHDQNAADAVARLKEWAPDLIVFAGGNILRKSLLDVPRLGVLNVHLGLLPEIRGMSSPEWSLLNQVPVGITLHYMDEGIDTGPVLQRYEYPEAAQCESLGDLRNRLIAFGVSKVGEVVAALDQDTICAVQQSELNQDNQFFVMHEWLQARAAECLRTNSAAVAGTANG